MVVVVNLDVLNARKLDLFLDFIGCGEGLLEYRFQVSGVRFQAGSHLSHY